MTETKTSKARRKKHLDEKNKEFSKRFNEALDKFIEVDTRAWAKRVSSELDEQKDEGK